MSHEHDVLFNINKFINDFDEANTPENSRVPFKDMFMQIRDYLKVIHDAVASDCYSLGEKTDSMRVSVQNLNELHQECLALSKKHRGSTGSCLNYYSPAQWLFLSKSREKLKMMTNYYKQVQLEVNEILSSAGETSHSISTSTESKPIKWTYGDVDESKIFGWDELAKEIITKSLLKENKEGLNVVGIIGMFGSGKTTLAQKIFLSEEVIDHFPLRLWVWVSAQCNNEELIRRMLDNLGVEEYHIEEMLKIDTSLNKVGVLLYLLHLELSNKRYLIVFDDVVKIETWHCELEKEPPKEEDKEWTGRLAYGLPKGNGSAIIITSRKEDDTRKMVGQGDIYSPHSLLGKDGWDLFKSSFEEVAKRPFDDPKLESLHEEITKKCDGLPLALKAAGERMALQKKEKLENEDRKKESGANEADHEVSSLPNEQDTEAKAPTLPN